MMTLASRMRDFQMPQTDRMLLLIANLNIILVIILHDADHVRQARSWCYTIPWWLWMVNVSVYVPNGAAFLLALRRSRLAAVVTVAGSLLIALEFAKVHLWAPTIPVWGIWNSTFFVLGADARSWWILAFTVLCAILSALAGMYVVGRQSERMS